MDGNDVLTVNEVSIKAVEQCRNGEGPVFIEFLTYRQRGHVGPDDNVQGSHTDIRPLDEIDSWLRNDPIENLTTNIESNFPELLPKLDTILLQVEKEIADSYDFAFSSKKPAINELTDYVFSR